MKRLLIVEDDPGVRSLAVKILWGHGYTVIESADAANALNKAEINETPIHLVLTDVVMPGMKGPELYEKIRILHPEAAVLYMSGYTDNMIVHHGILDEGISYLQKPFTARSLADKCRKVLRGRISS